MVNELYHHGVKGMHWHVRRYQNKDGSLTPAGKKKQAYLNDKIKYYEQELKNDRMFREQAKSDLVDIKQNGKKSKAYNYYFDDLGTSTVKEAENHFKNEIRRNNESSKYNERALSKLKSTKVTDLNTPYEIERRAKIKSKIQLGIESATSITAAAVMVKKGKINNSTALKILAGGLALGFVDGAMSYGKAMIEIEKWYNKR